MTPINLLLLYKTTFLANARDGAAGCITAAEPPSSSFGSPRMNWAIACPVVTDEVHVPIK